MHLYSPPCHPLCLIHVDDDILIVSKPSGLLSVPGKSPDHKECLESRLRMLFPECLTVHRLDMETSGLVIFARSKTVQANLGKQFERRKVNKTYLAWVSGTPKVSSGTIDLPLRCDWPNRPRQMVCFENGKSAQTHWKILQQGAGATLLELSPITGRSHQLRVHCAEMGHPILGDPFYAPEDVRNCVPRLQLHAQNLSLHHPKDGERIHFHDPAPF